MSVFGSSPRYSWKPLETFQSTIHRPCRYLGGVQATIYRASRCLEASQELPGSHCTHSKSRSIGPVCVWEFHKSQSTVPVSVCSPPDCPEVTIYRACEFLEASKGVPGIHLKRPQSSSVGPAGVWEAYKARSIVPVSVWSPPRLPRSHDLSCL